MGGLHLWDTRVIWQFMKGGNYMQTSINKCYTIQDNIRFLISMYKRSIEAKDTTWEEKEIYECYVDELEYILEVDKEREDK